MEHIIIDENLVCHVPESLRAIPQFNHNVQTYTIDCPRYTQNGEDMLVMLPFVSVEKTGVKEPVTVSCSNPIVDATDKNKIHFDWTITREVSDTPGKIGFVVCVRRSEEENLENAWHTYKCNEIEIKKGIDCGLDMMMQYPGLMEEILYRLGIVEKNGGTITSELIRQSIMDYLKEHPIEEEINIGNYGLTAQDKGNGVVEILLATIATSGVTQSGDTLTIIDGVTVMQNGSVLVIL